MTTRFGRAIQLLIGCGLILGALFFFRARRTENVKSVSEAQSLQVHPEQSGEIYQQRIMATRALLGAQASGL